MELSLSFRQHIRHLLTSVFILGGFLWKCVGFLLELLLFPKPMAVWYTPFGLLLFFILAGSLISFSARARDGFVTTEDGPEVAGTAGSLT